MVVTHPLPAGRSSGRRARTTARSSGRTTCSGRRSASAPRRQLRADALAAACSSAAARSIVTPPTSGYWSANQRRMLAVRAACSASSSDASRRRLVSSSQARTGRCARSPATASASVASSSTLSSSTGALTSFQVCSSDRLRPRSLQPALNGVEPDEQRADRLDREPALRRPLAQRGACATRAERPQAACGLSTGRSSSRGRIRAVSTTR